MSFEHILYEVEGPMALITIDREAEHNAITLATLWDSRTANRLRRYEE
jgi:enoyl-CoA hydratase/carnithine racemase